MELAEPVTREQALAVLREAVRYLRETNELGDVPPEVWHLLRGEYELDSEPRYQIDCTVHHDHQHFILVTADLYYPFEPVSLTFLRYRNRMSLRERLREAWLALKGEPIDERVLLDGQNLRRLRNFLAKIFLQREAVIQGAERASES